MTQWERFRPLKDSPLGDESISFSPESHFLAPRYALNDFYADMVIIGPLAAFHTCNEISATEIRKPLRSPTKLAQESEVAFSFVQQPYKNAQAPDRKIARGFMSDGQLRFSRDVLDESTASPGWRTYPSTQADFL